MSWDVEGSQDRGPECRRRGEDRGGARPPLPLCPVSLRLLPAHLSVSPSLSGEQQCPGSCCQADWAGQGGPGEPSLLSAHL